MPASYAETRNLVFLKRASLGRSFRCSEKRKEHMSRTIKAIERHMIPRSRIQPAPNGEHNLVAEWQQRGPEAIGNENWGLWFAILSPIIGALLGVLGVFILAR
jgi:hypothetical protein